MANYQGIVVYEIFPNGCLNGVYSNDHPLTQNEIFNEIARKKSKNAGKIDGDYTCCYIDLNNVAYICDLEIKNNSNQFQFTWYETGTRNVKFKGIGWLTRNNQITVMDSD